MRAASARAPRGWLYLPREWRSWTPETPAVVSVDEEISQPGGEARFRDYAPMVDDGTLFSVVVSAQDELGADTAGGLVEALVYYVRFDAFLPEIGAPDPPAVSKAQLRRDRAFYDALGPERSDVPCRAAGCVRGAVGLSVFCRVHHFRQVKGRDCPFRD